MDEDERKKKELHFAKRRLTKLLLPLYKEAFKPKSHPVFAVKIGSSIALSLLAWKLYKPARDVAMELNGFTEERGDDVG